MPSRLWRRISAGPGIARRAEPQGSDVTQALPAVAGRATPSSHQGTIFVNCSLAVSFAAAAVLGLQTAQASNSLASDLVSRDTALHIAEMIRIADGIGAAVDTKDWALARSHFTEII